MLRYLLPGGLILALLALALTACDSGGGSASPPALSGPDSMLVSAAVQDVDIDSRVEAAQICTDSDGRQIARTQMEIVFKPTATVGAANQLLSNIPVLKILSSTAGVAALVVTIPDPGCAYSMEEKITVIEADPNVWYVRRGYLPRQMGLPANLTPAMPELGLIDHQLAIGAPAAWNARQAVSWTPQLIIADSFGNGPPDADISYNGVAGDFNTVNSDSHGYHVLGIIAGSFGGASSARGLVTGIYPATINLRVIDTSLTNSLAYYENKIIALAKTLPGNLVLNTNFGYQCGNDNTCMDQPDAKLWAAVWAAKVRAAGLEDRLLHLTAAGNIEAASPLIRDAETASTFASAGLLPGLTDAAGAPVANLGNTLVVENDLAAESGAAAECQHESSFVGGDLGGIGTGVWSITGAGAGAGYMTGSSMASAQAAGLAAYLWSIKPALTPQQIIELLTRTARQTPVAAEPSCSDWPAPAPVINAYDALLALDDHAGPAPVRTALLDLADDYGQPGANGQFDELDLEMFLASLAEEPGQLDYGRADLNGDGRTGGEAVAAFDLDINNPPSYGTEVSIDLEGEPVLFDENALTDLQILCYYAYSPLFTGTPEARADLMVPVLDECRP